MHNYFVHGYPQTIHVEGKDREIYTDFRDILQLNELSEIKNKNGEIFFYIMGLLKEPMEAEYFEDICNEISRFISLDEYSEEGNGGGEPPFSFADDFPYILSGFRQYYQIDLVHVNYLHWYEFMNLLVGLPDESMFKKRVYYRTLDLSQIKDKDERKRLAKIKNSLRIKGERKELSISDIGNAFW